MVRQPYLWFGKPHADHLSRLARAVEGMELLQIHSHIPAPGSRPFIKMPEQQQRRRQHILGLWFGEDWEGSTAGYTSSEQGKEYTGCFIYISISVFPSGKCAGRLAVGDLARKRGRQEVMCLKNFSHLCQDSSDESIKRQQPWRWGRSSPRI